MKLFAELPYRISVVNTAYFIPVRDAVELVRIRRAREVFEADKFVGIELGNFGPKPSTPITWDHCWIELPGLRFEQPRNARPLNERTVTAYAAL